jgi:hypothetical protein
MGSVILIDIIAMFFGMIGSALNTSVSYRIQIFALISWLIADILLVIFLWDISVWLVSLNVFYIGTCLYGINKRKKHFNVDNNNTTSQTLLKNLKKW